MSSRIGIVLEGGAMRSIFSAGVVDFLMEKGVHVPNILAVSAGAYVGMNYASGQHGRCMKALVEPMKEYKYMGVSTFFKKGTFFDMDYLFDVVPKERSPFDFETFQKFDGRFITSTVNLSTGEAVYHENFESENQFFQVCKAANSMPFIAKVADINGVPMLDGGMADAIPIDKALEEGWDKVIVVLTRDITYRKKLKQPVYMALLKMVYHKYPKFIELVEGRAKRYNDSLEKIAQLESEGKVFLLRPTEVIVGNKESNVEKLTEYYQHGYDSIAERYEELLEFLEK
uniref:patatin-like phospholipase family protein n=1 Tax=Acetatifactor sp. TaxID=1872090 RepID=UPI004057B253